MHLPRQRWLWVGLVVVLALVGFWAFRLLRPEGARYRTAAVESGRLVASVSATGTVRPVVQVEVGSQVSGIISKLHVDYNDRVRAGQVLAEIEPSFFRTAVVQAEANVSRAEASLHEAERGLRRARELTERKVIAEVELEVAETTHEQRRAELEQARASLETARVNLSHTLIRSPINGVVLSRAVDVGQTVAASLQAPQLYILAGDLGAMQIETKIDEADIGQVNAGLGVSFTVDAFPERRFQGKVSQVRLEPIAEDNVVTYTTVIEVENPERLLRPGMTANVTIVVAEREAALKVPNAALRFRPPDVAANGAAAWAHGQGNARQAAAIHGHGAGGSVDSISPGAARGERRGGPPKLVYRLKRGGGLEPVPLRTGLTDGSFTEVTGGELAAGDQVVVGAEGASASNLAPPPGFGAPTGPGSRRR